MSLWYWNRGKRNDEEAPRRQKKSSLSCRRLLSASTLLALTLTCKDKVFCGSSSRSLYPGHRPFGQSHKAKSPLLGAYFLPVGHGDADVGKAFATQRSGLGDSNQWPVRRDQMILPAARIVTPTGTQGSAFIISQSAENGTYVMTNHHVIKDCIKQNDRWDPVSKSSSKVEQLLPVNVETFRYDDRGRHLQTVTTQAEIVAYTVYGDKWDFEGDLALLKLKAPVDHIPAASLIGLEDFADEVRMLDEVVMVGCPDGSPVPLPTTGHIASVTEERAGVGLMLSQVFGNPGSSGSAVYRYSAERNSYEVVAVHSMIDGRGSLTDVGRGCFLRLAIPASEVHGFLRRHSFEHLVAKAEEAPAAEEAEKEQKEDEKKESGTADKKKKKKNVSKKKKDGS
eukprot:TRINITY_DN53760_c0_g1_i1.p1 TRINITY_DN53760_c0_g1~~TRINITY_DN53760_c0_g1_i1.p1  ORF type:complete len:406 (-),score=61.54 TRINITY_DN53760_c0_g1_i1:160-1344(-)